MALVYILFRYRLYSGLDEFLDRAIFMGKALVLLLLYMTDTAVAMRWFVVAARKIASYRRFSACAEFTMHFGAVVFFLVKKPAFSGAAECKHLTAGGLEVEVMSAPEKEWWLVLYTANWNEDCQYVFPLFAALSATCVPGTLPSVHCLTALSLSLSACVQTHLRAPKVWQFGCRSLARGC
jgi:hypothetical protein